jgi:uncharacterized protein (TIRG00374 family)
MKYSYLLKIFLTIFLVGVLLLKINISEVIQIFKSINLYFLLISLLFVPLLCVIRTLRWTILLESIKIDIQFIRAFNLMMIGSFYGLLTPGKIGEFGRALHFQNNKSLSVATIMIEKMIDIGILFFLSFITILFFLKNEPNLLYSLIILGIGCLIVLILFFQESLLIKIGKLFGLDNNHINEFFFILKKLIHNYPLMIKSIGLTFFFYLMNYSMGIFLAFSAGFSPFAVISYPIIILIGNIPITISGIGIRESIGSIIFVILGESAANGFVYSLLVFVLTTLIPGIWGYFLSMRNKF